MQPWKAYISKTQQFNLECLYILMWQLRHIKVWKLLKELICRNLELLLVWYMCKVDVMVYPRIDAVIVIVAELRFVGRSQSSEWRFCWKGCWLSKEGNLYLSQYSLGCVLCPLTTGIMIQNNEMNHSPLNRLSLWTWEGLQRLFSSQLPEYIKSIRIY